MATITGLSFAAVNSGRKFIAGRIVNAFGFSNRLLEHFHDRGVKGIPASLANGTGRLARVNARAKKRFRGINIADPRYMALIEQK